MIGKTLGHYQVTEKLGAGGMGEVYRARDTRLNRDVALKCLPAAFASDQERLGRFQREAQLLAQLNHPNIGGIHGLEESGGLPYLVLEYVPGETLAQRISTARLPVEEAMELAAQIMAALEEAHGKGIVHRDLKPANVKITPDGKVKVLDFGLAKAFGDGPAEGDPTRSPTLSALATRMGTILGTPSYMSPEQARGKPLDKRTDVWAFGCVLYEMLAGQQAFGGDTVTDILAAVVGREPDWSRLPPDTPRVAGRLLRLCLEKDPSRRLRDIGDAWIGTEEPDRSLTVAAQKAKLRTWLPWALLALVTVVAAAAIWMQRAPAPTPRAVTRLATPLAPFPAVALSRDATRLAFLAGSPQRIHVRLMDQLEDKPIAGADNAWFPFFSPDGQWIGFFHENKLKKVQVVGGATMTLCDARGGVGASWGSDGSIIFNGLARVSAAGGKPEVLTKPDSKKGETAHSWPDILPGGQAVLFTIGTGVSYDDARIAVLDLKTREYRVLLEGGTSARYVPTGRGPDGRGTGHLVYWRNASLFAVPFDLGKLQVLGSPVPVLEGVRGFPTAAGRITPSPTPGRWSTRPAASKPPPTRWSGLTAKHRLSRAQVLPPRLPVRTCSRAFRPTASAWLSPSATLPKPTSGCTTWREAA